MATDRGREFLFKNKGKDSEVYFDVLQYILVLPRYHQVYSWCIELAIFISRRSDCKLPWNW